MSEEKKLNETKRDNFVRLAEKRTQKAVYAIENLSSLSDTRNYDYSDVDVKKILEALNDSLNQVKAAFKTKREKTVFKL